MTQKGGNPAWVKGIASPNPNGGPKKKLFQETLRLYMLRPLNNSAEGVQLDDLPPQPRMIDFIVLALIKKATEGDIMAIKEIASRLDGNPPQIKEGGDEEKKELKVFTLTPKPYGKQPDSLPPPEPLPETN